MKIKIKDEMNEINLKINHQELVLINEALKAYKEVIDMGERYLDKIDIVDNINNKVFDAHEFKNVNKIKNKLSKMVKKISKKLSKIYPY
jgi:hypothetical protein